MSFSALHRQISAERARLTRMSATSKPHQWALSHLRMGLALGELGQRQGRVAELEEAVAAFRSALPVLRQSDKASQTARALSMLAAALLQLGRRKPDKRALRESADALKQAIEFWPMEKMVSEWATAQMELCTALVELGQREDGSKTLEEAVAATHAGMEADHSGAGNSTQMALYRINLGEALAALGEREGDAAILQEAAAASRDALAVVLGDPDGIIMPAEQIHYAALCRQSLGQALSALGRLGHDVSALRQAVEVLRDVPQSSYDAAKIIGNVPHSVKVERDDFGWASVQHTLATALVALGEMEGDEAALREAVDVCRATLEIRTRELFPFHWAESMNTLGAALRALGERGRRRDLLTEAVAAHSAALAVFRADDAGHHIRLAERQLSRAEAALAALG